MSEISLSCDSSFLRPFMLEFNLALTKRCQRSWPWFLYSPIGSLDSACRTALSPSQGSTLLHRSDQWLSAVNLSPLSVITKQDRCPGFSYSTSDPNPVILHGLEEAFPRSCTWLGTSLFLGEFPSIITPCSQGALFSLETYKQTLWVGLALSLYVTEGFVLTH